MKKLFSLVLVVFIALSWPESSTGQEGPAELGLEPEPISLQDQFTLMNVPLLELPEAYRGPNAPMLPVSVDNSTKPYFRSITSQSGYECGQSAGVAFNFTYEIDRKRDLPANTTDNTYPTHFVWDFLNNGYNYQGASFFDSWEIIRACGTMNVTDYGGGLNTGGEKRWISGYNVYYNGMKNRLITVKAIRCDNPTGLQTLKYWLVDHLEGSNIGGVANFYAKYYGSVTTVFPPGTPEEGKYVQTSWGPSPTHAWTVCGYNDSVRFDYNNDGQYTNNIDITGDGIVDMHDWEIGGLKFANGYAGTGWCNQGFCYMMYKTLADNIGYGGIWEHTVFVLDVKETCEPQLTMKVTLKHTSRDMLKVTVGMNTNVSATTPAFIYEYPIFNFQGGPYYMQGGTSEADKTIEFGLDLTPVLSDLSSGQMAKFFLNVEENDPGSSATGEITQMALIDYTSGGPQTVFCTATPTPIVNNSTTRVSVTRTMTYDKPGITTVSLPPAQLYQPYSCQLTGSGGTPPYRWDVKLDYPEELTTGIYPSVNAEALTPSNTSNGYATKVLDFFFPFYKQSVRKLYIYVDGFIVFDDRAYTYPYLIDPDLLYHQTAIISPFMTDLRLYSSVGDGLWYEGDANSATIRWKASINNMAGSSSVDFAVKLYPSGLIEYYYGNMNFPVSTSWIGGISGGDNSNYQYIELSGATTITTGSKDILTACGYPVEMTLSETGLFSGTPQNLYTNRPIRFRVTDNNGIANTKVLNFTTNGLLVNYSLDAGGDSLVEYGDTTMISLSLTNLGTQALTGVTSWITKEDPYITLMDSTEAIGYIGGGQTKTFPDAFRFRTSTTVPDEHPFTLQFHEASNEQSIELDIDLTAYAPDIVIGAVTLTDGDNGKPDPGETTDMRVVFENHGGAKVHNLQTTLSSTDPLMTIDQGSGTIALLKPDSVQELTYTITASDQAPFEHLYLINSQLSANNGYSSADSICLLAGNIVEDFETGTFQKFPWYFGGFADWAMDDFQPHEGVHDIKSGWIYDNEDSEILITLNILADGEIGFWKRVSCEDDPNGTEYDYFAFFIDNQEMGRWDGDNYWDQVSYPVSKGIHTFRWLYHKDYSVSAYFDRTWLDYITFPPFEGALPDISVTPASMSHTLDPGEYASNGMVITNTGGGLLHYTIQVFDTTQAKPGQPDNLTGSWFICSESTCVAGQEFSWNLTVHNGSPDDEYIKNIRIDFPADVTVNSATSFSGGSLGDLEFDGTTGAGVTVNWHGESGGGKGVIKPNENATAVVTGSIAEGSDFDVYLVYVIEGDHTGYGTHLLPGEIRLANEGLSNNWLSLSANTGSLLSGDSDTLTVYFTTCNVPSGGHDCHVLVRDLYNNITVIPAHLHINWPVGVQPEAGNPAHLSCYPNPSHGSMTIRYSLEADSPVQLDLFDLQGMHLMTLMQGLQAEGEHRITWTGDDREGVPLPQGIYTLRMTTPDKTETIKLILIR